jgi:hypothetical protein
VRKFDRGMELGGDGVLMYEAAEPVVSADRGAWRGCGGPPRVPGFGRSEGERAVRPMAVVVLDELTQPLSANVV